MRCKVLTTILLAGILACLVGCRAKRTPTPEPTSPPAQATLKISGSGTVVPILRAIAPAFEADVPGCSLQVLAGTGTGGGVRGVAEGILDVAAMARPPKDEEAAQGLEYVEFGQSGVAVLVHLDVGVRTLTTAQVETIFSGEVTNWSKVGGSNLDIVLYVRDSGDSSTKVLRQTIFGDTPFPETAHVLTSQADMQIAVAETPGSVGFGSWPSVLANGANVGVVILDGVAPGDSTYSIVTPIGVGYLVDRKAEVQSLINWLLSEQGRVALREFDVLTVH